MALDIIQFVDKIDASPTVRLNLNDGTTWRVMTKPAPDFSPPPLKKVRVATLLTDGNYIPASAYENRRLRFTVRVAAATEDAAATELQKLHRELDRQNNILKYQRDGSTVPVFFRTFRSPDYRLHSEYPDPVYRADLEIEAEPFARGLRVTQSPVTVNNDPAAGSNGLFLSVTNVTGDVPTEAFIEINPPNSQATELIAVRRHGTPAMYWVQAEACTQGTDTATQANDALMSGAGNNFSRTTFATATMQTRLTWTGFPGAAGVDIRGRYRVFARIRRQDITSDINIEMRVPAGIVTEKITTVKGIGPFWQDLGLISVPSGLHDPITEGPSNVSLPVANHSLEFRAERLSGTAYLDWDAIVAVPADEELALFRFSPAVNDEVVLDGSKDLIFQRDMTSGNISIPVSLITRAGALPLLTPNQTNLLLLFLQVGGEFTDDKTWTASVTVSFWPAYLVVRPAST